MVMSVVGMVFSVHVAIGDALSERLVAPSPIIPALSE